MKWTLSVLVRVSFRMITINCLRDNWETSGMPLGRPSPCHLLLKHPWEMGRERSCRSPLPDLYHQEVISLLQWRTDSDLKLPHWVQCSTGVPLWSHLSSHRGRLLKRRKLRSYLRGNKRGVMWWEAGDHQVWGPEGHCKAGPPKAEPRDHLWNVIMFTSFYLKK